MIRKVVAVFRGIFHPSLSIKGTLPHFFNFNILLIKFTNIVNGDENSMIKVEETVLLVCEGRCISISKEILTAYSTLYAAKLSDRWKEGDNFLTF